MKDDGRSERLSGLQPDLANYPEFQEHWERIAERIIEAGRALGINLPSVKRWIKLVEWWNNATGRRIADPSDIDTSGILGLWIGDPRNQDETVLDFLRGTIESLDIPSDLQGWDKFEGVQIEKRRKLHDNLVAAAKAVLEMRMPLDGFDYKPIPNKAGFYEVQYWEQVFPPDNACWDSLVSPEAVKAAVMLASLDNPYPAPKMGRGLVSRGRTAERRALVLELNKLTRADGRPMKPKELTVFCLLVKPDYFVDVDDDGIPEYLKGQGDWTPVDGSGRPNPNSLRLDAFFKSAGFVKLRDTIGKDLKPIRVGWPRTKSEKSRAETPTKFQK